MFRAVFRALSKIFDGAQPAIKSSKLAIEILEQSVKYIQSS